MSRVPSYQATHWGLPGPVGERRARVPDPHVGPIVELGHLVSVVYLTRKAGDRSSTEYEHEFSRPLPLLCYCPGGLLICGGRYTVKVSGING